MISCSNFVPFSCANTQTVMFVGVYVDFPVVLLQIDLHGQSGLMIGAEEVAN